MPSLARIAVAWIIGTLIASLPVTQTLGPGVALLMWCSALLWLVLAYGVRSRAILIVIALLGAMRMTLDQLDAVSIDLPAGAVADDRALDRITGVVTGPVVRERDRRRFVIVADAPARVRIQVTTSSSAAVSPGARVRVNGRLRATRGYRVPGAMSFTLQLRARGADLSMTAREVQVIDARAHWTPWRWAGQVHQQMTAAIRSRAGDPAHNAVVRAMVTGDRSGLDRDLMDRYRDAGVAHILAVSGLHLAVITLLAFAGVRRVWAAFPGLYSRVRPNLVATASAAPTALGYALMTGGRISTMRALLVVVVVLAGVALSRRARVLDALGLAALALLIHRPASLFDPSFQLSFAATATLVLVGRGQRAANRDPAAPHAALAKRAWCAVRNLIVVALWALLATLPFTALAFGQIAIAGAVTNVVAVPLVEFCIVPLGVGGTLLSQLSPEVGGWLLDIAIAAAGWLDGFVAIMADLVPTVPVFPPTSWELGAALLVWAGAIGCVRERGRKRGSTRRYWLMLALGLVVLIGSYVVSMYVTPRLRTDVRIAFLDVGQGDATVIELPGGRVWMIDGGGLPFVSPNVRDRRERQRLAAAPGRLAVARFLAHRRIRRIHRLIISHPHPDHYEGIHALVGVVPIDELWIAREYEHTAPSYRGLVHALVRAGTSIYHPRLDTPYGDERVSMTVLAPRVLDRRATADPVSGHNDNSLVIRLDAFGRRVLFTGDIEREGEDLLVARWGTELHADIVKVPHHGSRSSSTPAFVAATTPVVAVISCGVANRFGFPATSVVARWRRAGARVLQTDRSGTITVHIAPDGTMDARVFDP